MFEHKVIELGTRFEMNTFGFLMVYDYKSHMTFPVFDFRQHDKIKMNHTALLEFTDRDQNYYLDIF